MDSMVVTWIGIGIVVILSIVGWVFAYNRYSRNEAMHIGEIKGLVEGLGNSMESIEKRMGNMERRLDAFISNWPGDVGD